MSKLFDGNLIYKHEAVGSEHRITLFDSTGKAFCEGTDPTEMGAYNSVENELWIKIKTIDKNTPLRKILRCCDKKGDGKFKIKKDFIQAITQSDYENGHLGLITQSEMARIMGISRQAVNQRVDNGSIENFVYNGSRMIPFDNVSTLETSLEPMVMYFGKLESKPIRRRN